MIICDVSMRQPMTKVDRFTNIQFAQVISEMSGVFYVNTTPVISEVFTTLVYYVNTTDICI